MGFGVNDNNSYFLGNSFDPNKDKDKGIKGLSLKTPESAQNFFDQAKKVEAGANVNDVIGPKNATATQDVHETITNMTQNGGAGIVKNANAAAGNELGSTAGKPNDKNLKPSLATTFDKEGNPVFTGLERGYGDRFEVKEGKDLDGSKQYNATLSDKNGNMIAQNILTENTDGSKNIASFSNEKDKTISRNARYDKDNKLIDGTTTTTSRDGKEETTVQKREADGSYTSTTTKPDGTVQTAKYDKDGNPVEPKKEAEKGTHKEGSLGDIKEQKADMLDKKKEQVAKQLETGSGKASEKYQGLDKQSKEIDSQIAKLDPKKDEAKIDSLKEKQDELKAKQSKMVDKIAKKSLAKDDTFKGLEEQEQKEQKLVDKYKDFDLTDKEDGHKLTDEEISDKKDQLFDKDNKVLDRKTLAEKGIDKKYTDKAIADNPMRVFLDENASKEEKDQALVSVVLQNAMGGNTPVQRAQGLQGQDKIGAITDIVGGLAKIFSGNNDNQSSSTTEQVPFTLASKRSKK